MKKVMIVLTVMAVFLWVGFAQAGEFQVVKAGDSQVEFKLPIFDAKNPVVSASFAWTDGKEWTLIASDDYTLKSKPQGEYVVAEMKFPDQGNGWFWVRAWGRDEDGEWLNIDVKSPFCRNDGNGKPGYEFLVNPREKQWNPVPASTEYEVRP